MRHAELKEVYTEVQNKLVVAQQRADKIQEATQKLEDMVTDENRV